MSDDEYTKSVDNGSYASDKFIHDNAGYGLAQWTYWSRKKNLYDYARSHGRSVGDLRTQLDFLWGEILLYPTVVEAMKNWKSLRDISDVICKKYLKPAKQSEHYLQNRANYGQGFYDNFAKVNETTVQNTSPAIAAENKSEKQSVEASKTVSATGRRIIAKDNVNIRVGNGKNYDKIGTLKAGSSVPWVATASNGWHAFDYNKRVCWVSGEFAEVK